jgi:hypothetical protein
VACRGVLSLDPTYARACDNYVNAKQALGEYLDASILLPPLNRCPPSSPSLRVKLSKPWSAHPRKVGLILHTHEPRRGRTAARTDGYSTCGGVTVRTVRAVRCLPRVRGTRLDPVDLRGSVRSSTWCLACDSVCEL